MAQSNPISFVPALATLLAAANASAIEVHTGTEAVTLEINPQVQSRIEEDFGGPSGSAAPGGQANLDFSIRRARLLVRGTAYEHFTFAILLAVLRLGERGNFNAAPFLQELRVGYVPAKD